MATPPPVLDVEVDSALDRIERRHRAVDDPHWSEAGTAPRDVLTYVIGPQSARLPRRIAEADAIDAMVLWAGLWWEERRLERRLLQRGRHLGVSLADLGAPLGIETRQGVQDRIDRLNALLTYDRPDEQLQRASRRAAASAKAEQASMELHRGEIANAISEFLHQIVRVLPELVPRLTLSGSRAATLVMRTPSTEVDETGTWLDELVADYLDDSLTPATLVIAGLAAAELRANDRVLELDERHHLHTALRRIDLLRSKHRALGGTAEH